MLLQKENEITELAARQKELTETQSNLESKRACLIAKKEEITDLVKALDKRTCNEVK